MSTKRQRQRPKRKKKERNHKTSGTMYKIQNKNAKKRKKYIIYNIKKKKENGY